MTEPVASPGREYSFPDARQHFEVLKELGDCCASMGDHARADEAYRHASSLDPLAAGPYVGMGTVATQTDRLDLAVRAFRQALRNDPRCAEAYGGLAIVHQRRKEYSEAFDVYLKCLELDSDNLVALLGLFQTSCRMGTFRRIIHYLERFLQRHPGDTSVLFCLASLYAREGAYERASDALLSVLALEPDKAEAVDLLEQVQSRLAEASPQGVAS